MNVKYLNQILEGLKNYGIYILLPDGTNVANCFHVTEVAKIKKTFIDCGRIHREKEFCTIQLWVGEDKEHRLKTDVLFKILNESNNLFKLDDLEIEIEYGENTFSSYLINLIEVGNTNILIYLKDKKTECLSPDKCIKK